MRGGRAWKSSNAMSLVPSGDVVTGGATAPDPDGPAPHLEADPSPAEAEAAGGWAYVVAAGGPLALALFFLVESLELGLGSLSAPGPGLWPFALSAALAPLTVVLLLGWSRFGPCESWGVGSAMTIVGAASVAPFIVLAPSIGFELPAVALLVFWMKVLGGESWQTSVAVAVGAVTALHLVFVEGLGLNVPYLFGL